MYEIEMHDVSEQFVELWKSAGSHLDKQVQGGIQTWLRANLAPPFLEHLSFRLGNQLFFIRVVDVDARVEGPSSIRGLLTIADGCKGHACLMPMKKKMFGGWNVERSGWGLIDARSGETIDPIPLVTDELIEMTDWELHDFAVQIVRKNLEQQGYKLMSWQSNPQVNPAIWFVGDSGGPEGCVVSFSRFSKKPAPEPTSWEDIAKGCAHLSSIGHFAPVGVASTDDPFDPVRGTWMPLYRGHGLNVMYKGLEALPVLKT